MNVWIKRAITIVDTLLKYYIIVLMGLLVVLTFAQVVARYLMKSPFTSTPQYARLVLVWLTFMGAAMGLRQDKLVRIEVLEERLPRIVKKILRIFFDLVLLALLLIIIIKGWVAAIVTNSQIVAGTPLNYSAFVISVVSGAVIMVFYIILRLWGRIAHDDPIFPRRYEERAQVD